MTIAVGDSVPQLEFMIIREGRAASIPSSEVLGSGRVVLFAVPGAFTPGCSKMHLPSYVQRA
ncbi:MAG: peroxiredoxin, partial [Actinomycetota bacterium]|nr:peroxiredoxin [Actinomycetota bacterium]